MSAQPSPKPSKIGETHLLGRKPSKAEDLDKFPRASKFGVGLEFPPIDVFDWSTDPESPASKLARGPSQLDGGVELEAASFLKSAAGIAGALRVGPGPKAAASACYFFGGLLVALDLPASYVDPSMLPVLGGPRITWDLPVHNFNPDPKAAKKAPSPTPTPKHGKIAIVSGVNAEVVSVVVWGCKVFMTWQAFHKHTPAEAGGELFAVVDPEWLEAMAAKHPDALDWAGLRETFGLVAPSEAPTRPELA